MTHRRRFVFAAAFLMLACLTASAEDGTHDAVVTLTAHVEQFAEWADTTPDLVAGDFTGSGDGTTINHVGEFVTATKVMTLYANEDVTITAAATTNGGIATEPTNSDTLTTSYKITGDVAGSADYLLAGAGVGQFFNGGNTYVVTHVPNDGAYTINLGVKLETDTDRAHDAGDYTCQITLTATW